MPFLIKLIGALIIGYLAQSQKGRTGFVWGLIAFISSLIIEFLANLSIPLDDDLRYSGVYDKAIALTGTIFSTIFYVIIVWTLPSKKSEVGGKTDGKISDMELLDKSEKYPDLLTDEEKVRLYNLKNKPS